MAKLHARAADGLLYTAYCTSTTVQAWDRSGALVGEIPVPATSYRPPTRPVTDFGRPPACYGAWFRHFTPLNGLAVGSEALAVSYLLEEGMTRVVVVDRRSREALAEQDVPGLLEAFLDDGRLLISDRKQCVRVYRLDNEVPLPGATPSTPPPG
jgi:hypothetical protein